MYIRAKVQNKNFMFIHGTSNYDGKRISKGEFCIGKHTRSTYEESEVFEFGFELIVER